MTDRFGNIGSLQGSSDVRIRGINVGTAACPEFDKKIYDALVALYIKNNINLPKDTIAGIGSGGFISEPHVILKRRGLKEFFANGN